MGTWAAEEDDLEGGGPRAHAPQAVERSEAEGGGGGWVDGGGEVMLVVMRAEPSVAKSTMTEIMVILADGAMDSARARQMAAPKASMSNLSGEH
jgi:hypothetical protein